MLLNFRARKTAEEGNEKADLDYNTWLGQLKGSDRSQRNPDWMAQFRIGDVLYEFLYGEAAGPSCQPTTVRTEGEHRKLIRLMSQSVRQTKRKLISQFSNIVDSDLMKDVRNIPRFGMFLY